VPLVGWQEREREPGMCTYIASPHGMEFNAYVAALSLHGVLWNLPYIRMGQSSGNPARQLHRKGWVTCALTRAIRFQCYLACNVLLRAKAGVQRGMHACMERGQGKWVWGG
jgi:hypothetical protein